MGIKSSISAISLHPRKTVLAIAGYEGYVLLWDYMKKEYLNHGLNFEWMKKENFTTLSFTPDGDEILVGQQNGFIKVMDSNTGLYKNLTTPL